MTPFPKKPPLSAGNRLFFFFFHILPGLKLLTAYYKKAYPGMSGYFFFRFRFYDDVAKACLEKNKRDAIFRFVSRAVSGSQIAFSSATENLITGENLNDKTLEKIHRIMVKEYQLIVHRFDPNSAEEYLSKFGLTLLDHVGPEEFKQRHKIRKKCAWM